MIKTPQPLREGDKIAIVSPAGIPNPAHVHSAADILRQQGYVVEIMPHALGKWGSYSGTDEERFSDLYDALTDPEVRAVLCGRGGYGAVHILDRLDKLPLAEDPKWVIGFSDISALHALMHKHGVKSVHASMCSHIRLGKSDPDNALLFGLLKGEHPNLRFKSHTLDRLGVADGKLVGGNLAVLADLIGTPYDLLQPDTILFIEDIAEPIYKIERVLYQLTLNGVLPNIKGLIVGQFTDYKGDKNYDTMEAMVHEMVKPYSYPVAFDAPIGHVFHNSPVVEGSHVTLRVTSDPEGENSLIYWP